MQKLPGKVLAIEKVSFLSSLTSRYLGFFDVRYAKTEAIPTRTEKSLFDFNSFIRIFSPFSPPVRKVLL